MIRILNVLHWLSRILLGGLLIYSGYIKVRQPLQFAVAVSSYKLLPDNLVWPVASYFPWVEIILGLALLIGWKIRYFSLGAVGLLLFFTAILLITYFRGIEANCGCFSFNDPISLKTIFRDALLMIPAVFLAIESQIRERMKARFTVNSAGPAASM